MSAVPEHLSRMRSQGGMLQRLELYQGMVEAVQGCIVCMDSFGSIGFANRYASQLLDAQSLDELAQALRASIVARVPELDTRHELAGGTRIIRWTLTPLLDWAQLASDEVVAEGVVLAKPSVLAFGMDVTHRLAFEQSSAESEALRAMGMLANNLAHEIRNPLNAATLQLELLLSRAERIGDGLAADVGGPAFLVRAAIGRLSVLLEEFLHLARPSATVRRVCSVAELFQSVLTLQRPLLASTGVELRSYVHDEGLEARCDAGKIRQLLDNLVRNSVDALSDRDDGRVELHAERRADGGVSIAVLDNGRGVARNMLGDAAFSPFSTTKPAGSGLGLAIARRIVAQHGGTIQLLARPGEGTAARFWISA